MPEENKGASFIHLTCPICQGSGREERTECSRCQGKGVFAWLSGDYIYWEKKINVLALLIEKMEKTIKLFINGFLILFGLIGLIMVVLAIWEISKTDKNIWEFIFQRDFKMTVFAISLLTDIYAYYRITRESILEKAVKRKSYETLLTTATPATLFEEMSRVDKDKFIEISSTLNNDAVKAIDRAWLLARQLNHGQVEPIHLFGVLLPFQKIRVVLARLGVNPTALMSKISRALHTLSQRSSEKGDLSVDTKKVLLGTYKEAYMGRKEKVDVTQLLVALAEAEGISKEILYDLEIELNDVKNVVEWINIREMLSKTYSRWRSRAAERPKGVMNKSMTAVATPLLDRFSHDLTQLAKTGALPLSIGREKELQETFRILESGRNNVLLVGFPGVGKTSIVDKIAQMMASEEVPEILQDKRLVSLSIASLVGSAGRQGELEGLLMDIINEIVKSGNIVLFIDHLQNMIGVTTEGAENLDISDILSQALAKRLFYCISATNPVDYRRYIERNTALTSVFQTVNVEELEANEAIRVLEGKAGFIEAKNQVFFSYKSIAKTVELAQRYIHERYLPEKAINVMEEVAVYVRKKKGKNSVISAEDVAEIISSKFNVPVTKVTEEESEKLLNLEEQIHQRIIDQDEAVKAVSTALRRARAELRDIRRPIVNLLFLGPTGVGKTELAKTVAEVYFGSENDMISPLREYKV